MEIEHILNKLYKCRVNSKEEILGEMLRVKLTKKYAEKTDIDGLYETMKAETEKPLGHFPGDKDFFYWLYNEIANLDIAELFLQLFSSDRRGDLLSPKFLTDYLMQEVSPATNYDILITEAEKHISELEACVSSHPKARFTLTANTPLMKLLLELVFDGNRHVEILQESIYSPCLIDWAFDYIICIPMLGGKTDDVNSQFLTKETSFIAFENLLSHLKQNGVMQIAMPAKITFAGAGIAKLRKKITENYSLNSIAILPDGIFRPAISIKSYLLTVQNKKQGNVLIYNLKLDSDKLSAKVKGEILQENFIAFNDWRIELLLSKEDDNICRFNHSQTQKVKLKEVAEVFRGKSILKKTSSQGNIYILNISNIENSEIDYSSLEAIDEDRRKIKRYELNDGDIVLTCRGTAVKSALFKRQEKPVIASSNIVVIRVGEKVTSGYIFLFLQSPVGISLIKSFRRSTAVMNLNHTDIMEMEIPMLPLTVQKEISKDYEEEILKYNETIRTAGNRISEIKNELYKKIL